MTLLVDQPNVKPADLCGIVSSIVEIGLSAVVAGVDAAAVSSNDAQEGLMA